MSPESPTRILIVDDEVALMKALCDTLRDHNFSPSGFQSANDALEALRTSPFEILLTDLMMPEMDGIALLRRAIEIDPDLAAVIMTGQGTIDTAVEAMKVGALDYVLKPFKLSVVLPVLSRALSIRQLRIDNAKLDKEVRQRTEELEAANRELEAFSHSVSHDLRAPLRAIDGFSSILVDELASIVPPDAERLLRDIRASAQYMSQMTEDLLRLSRLGRQSLVRQPVNVGTLVLEVLDTLHKIQREHPIHVQIGELPECIGDKPLLRQVFVNLLSNAFKFTSTRESGMVEIGCRRDAGANIYFVRDNGVGFNSKYADKLFAVFQRLHRSDEFEGTGVGLSIVQRIVDKHGGRIWAESVLGEGATFYFTIPAMLKGRAASEKAG